MPKRKRVILYSIVALLMAMGIAFVVLKTSPGTPFYFSAGWLLSIALLLWWGNRKLSFTLDDMLPWSTAGNLRFFVHLLLGLGYLLILINVTYVVLKVTLTADPPTNEQLIVMNVYGVFIFVPVFSIYFSLHFLKHWRKSELEVARFQRESIRAQLEALKNHLDPHFLFNNLNILSALIDTDSARSREYVDKLADVYRAILRRRADDLIPVTEELACVDAYIYLLRARFEDNVQFTLTLDPAYQDHRVPPLAVQMLIENAIKHNHIQPSNPLIVEVYAGQPEYLTVRNTLLAKTSVETSGSGLQNIQNRYAHFTDKPVRIVRTPTHFEVSIPLLYLEELTPGTV